MKLCHPPVRFSEVEAETGGFYVQAGLGGKLNLRALHASCVGERGSSESAGERVQADLHRFRQVSGQHLRQVVLALLCEVLEFSVRYIDRVENQEAGRRLGAWYDNARILNNDAFILVVGN